MKDSPVHFGAAVLVIALALPASTALADTLTVPQVVEGGVQLKVAYTTTAEKLSAPETFTVVSSDPASLHGPATITVSGGSTTFLITTGQVKLDTKVELVVQKPVAGRPPEVKAAATLLVLAPPSVRSISFSPTSVVGGQSSTGRITINRPASAGGVAIVMASNNGVVTFRSTPAISEGASTATVGINTATVEQTTSVSVSASSGGSTTSSTLSVRPAAVISSLTVPSPLTSGAAAQNGQIALAEAAFDAVTVSLQAAPASLQTPATVTVPAGATTASFSVSGTGLSFGAADVPAQLTASIPGSTKQAAVTIKAPLPPSLISVTPVASRQLIGSGSNKLLVLQNDPMTVRVSGAGVARVSLLDHPGSFAEGSTVSPGLTTFTVNFVHPGGGNVEAAVPGFATLFSESGTTIGSTQFGDLYYFDTRPVITASSGKDIVVLPGDGNIEIPGQHMIVDGTGFSPKVGTVTPGGSLNAKVTIDGQQAQLISVSPTRIELIVPNVSNCFGVKNLSVNNGAQPSTPGAPPVTATNLSVPCPSIESITPTSVNSATTTGTSYIIRVRGNYLGKMNPTISVNGVNGTVLPVSQNEVEVQFPRTITSGQVVITTPWGTTAGSGGNTLSVF